MYTVTSSKALNSFVKAYDAELEISKASRETRTLVDVSSMSRADLIALITERAKNESADAIGFDIIVARISLALKASDDANLPMKDRKPREHFERDASIIISKEELTKTKVVNDKTRSAAEQKAFDAATKWRDRAFTEAGIKTSTKQGGSRKASMAGEKASPTAEIVTHEPTTKDASKSETFSVSVPRPKASHDLCDAIMALVTAAAKLMGDASATKALDGDEGLICRDALCSILEVGKVMTDQRNALALRNEKPNVAKVAAISKAHIAKEKIKAMSAKIEELH